MDATVDQPIRRCRPCLVGDDPSTEDLPAAPDPLGLRLIAGDEQVLAEICRTYGPGVERWLARKFEGRLRSFEIEDVLWEALERLWESRGSYDPRTNPSRATSAPLPATWPGTG